jgi:hypothetical protein
MVANLYLKVGDINPRRYPSNSDHALASRARPHEAIVHHHRVLRVGEVEPVRELHTRRHQPHSKINISSRQDVPPQ